VASGRRTRLRSALRQSNRLPRGGIAGRSASCCGGFAGLRPPNNHKHERNGRRRTPNTLRAFRLYSRDLAHVRRQLAISGRPDSNRGPHRPESLGQVAWFPRNACKGAGSGYACRLQLVRYFLGYEGIWAVGGPSLPKLLVLGSSDRRTSQPLLIAAGSVLRLATFGLQSMIAGQRADLEARPCSSRRPHQEAWSLL
jgi:hypothetical protein